MNPIDLDLLLYGNYFEKDGKRVDPSEVEIHEEHLRLNAEMYRRLHPLTPEEQARLKKHIEDHRKMVLP